MKYHLRPIDEMGDRQTFTYRGKRFTKASFWKALRAEAEKLEKNELRMQDVFFWFKVVDESNGACSGGHGHWPVPRNLRGREVPSDWTVKLDGEIIPCSRGYHLCPVTGINSWWGHGRRVYLADWPADATQSFAHETKVAVSQARLVKYLGQMNMYDEHGVRVPFHKYPNLNVKKLNPHHKVQPMPLIDVLPIMLSKKALKAHAKSQHRQSTKFNRLLDALFRANVAKARKDSEKRAAVYKDQRNFVINTLSMDYFDWCQHPDRKELLVGIGAFGAAAHGMIAERLAMWWYTKVNKRPLSNTITVLSDNTVSAVLVAAQIRRSIAADGKYTPDQLKQVLSVI